MYVTKIMLLALLEKTLWYKISMILMEIFLMMTILEAFFCSRSNWAATILHPKQHLFLLYCTTFIIVYLLKMNNVTK